MEYITPERESDKSVEITGDNGEGSLVMSHEDEGAQFYHQLYGAIDFPGRPVSLKDLDPVKHSTPTPLDPNRVLVGANSYRTFAEQELLSRLDGFRKVLPDDLFWNVAFELETRQKIMINRNRESYGRLLKEVEARGSLDETLADIIYRARGGRADTNELLRLIKEYPPMISVTFAELTSPFQTDTILDTQRYIDSQVARLSRMFEDAEVTLLADDDAVLISSYKQKSTGVIVQKHKIADIKSQDSHTEAIRKRTFIELPVVDGEAARFAPIGISGYFRAANYKELLEQQSIEVSARESERRALGATALDAIAGLLNQDDLDTVGGADEYKRRVEELIRASR